MAKETVLIVSGGEKENIAELLGAYDEWRNAQFIGVDAGNMTLLELGYPIDLAVGDFDSISNEQMEMLKLVAKEIHVLPAEKDDTDTQVALLLAMKKFPEASSFRIFGATGGRIDHFLSNLFLPLEERFASIAEKIEFHNEKNVVKFFGKGTHRWFKNVEMKYLGFANLTPVEKFTILDAKYTLPSTNITQLFAYPSNEFLGNKVHFSLEKGLIVGVQSKD